MQVNEYSKVGAHPSDGILSSSRSRLIVGYCACVALSGQICAYVLARRHLHPVGNSVVILGISELLKLAFSMTAHAFTTFRRRRRYAYERVLERCDRSGYETAAWWRALADVARAAPLATLFAAQNMLSMYVLRRGGLSATTLW